MPGWRCAYFPERQVLVLCCERHVCLGPAVQKSLRTALLAVQLRRICTCMLCELRAFVQHGCHNQRHCARHVRGRVPAAPQGFAGSCAAPGASAHTMSCSHHIRLHIRTESSALQRRWWPKTATAPRSGRPRRAACAGASPSWKRRWMWTTSSLSASTVRPRVLHQRFTLLPLA